MTPTTIRLDIEPQDLIHLIYHLDRYTFEHRQTFTALADRLARHPAHVCAAWITYCLANYSLCALSADEFLDQVETGQRCDPTFEPSQQDN